ncbi:hypothetical protein [Sphingomonas sp.]
MMIVNLLILILLSAWVLQITLAVGTATYLIARSLTQREPATAALHAGAA